MELSNVFLFPQYARDLVRVRIDRKCLGERRKVFNLLVQDLQCSRAHMEASERLK